MRSVGLKVASRLLQSGLQFALSGRILAHPPVAICLVRLWLPAMIDLVYLCILQCNIFIGLMKIFLVMRFLLQVLKNFSQLSLEEIIKTASAELQISKSDAKSVSIWYIFKWSRNCNDKKWSRICLKINLVFEVFKMCFCLNTNFQDQTSLYLGKVMVYVSIVRSSRLMEEVRLIHKFHEDFQFRHILFHGITLFYINRKYILPNMIRAGSTLHIFGKFYFLLISENEFFH